MAGARPGWGGFGFFDGPPFATGRPHYGHLLAGAVKDAVCRYAHQTGHRVERRFGWDCHGLPVEFEVEKLIKVASPQEVAEYGIANYNQRCREIVLRYSAEWEDTIIRSGRWVDFENNYKTMDISFMESVWWVFSELFKKGLVYKGSKVMPYSTACTTPLANFECNLNYKDVSDPSVTVLFPLANEENTYLAVWTTTPWTLPSNCACCVHPTLIYVKIKEISTNRLLILAEERLNVVFKKSEAYQIIETFKGETLRNVKYVPLFNYFDFLRKEPNSAFRVLVDEYVTNDSGTGIVHNAPGFGEDDYRVCKEANITESGVIICPIDAKGCFTTEVRDYQGRYIKDCDDDICGDLKKRGLLLSKASIVHSYPHCWRSDTPLIYRSIESWFIRVETMIEQLLANNNQIVWVPEFVKTKRFSNWLKGARDWNISRNRYWGTPLPIWTNEAGDEVVCIGSIAELKRLSGVKNITDIHREFIDDITIPSQRGPEYPNLHRVTQVFDCWFESGSMPYAQCHYPFENKESFEQSFPAHFIAEGLDQTRGWFYTLLVISTALFNKPPFLNVIVNGLVLAEDGTKMSKRKKNYPEPLTVINKYGADSLRLYLINSPLVRAEPLKFSERGVKETLTNVFIPLINTTKFFVSQMNRYIEQNHPIAPIISISMDNMMSTVCQNPMDQWIRLSTVTLVRHIQSQMSKYQLFNVMNPLLLFINQLNGWYVRMNRRRIKGVDIDENEWADTLATLFFVLHYMSRALACIIPFFTEFIYQRIKPLLMSEAKDSVHHTAFPSVPTLEHTGISTIESGMLMLIKCVDAIRVVRDQCKLSLKFPVKSIVVIIPDPNVASELEKLSHYVQSEVNSFHLEISSDISKYANRSIVPNGANIGKRIKEERAQAEVNEVPKESKEASRKYWKEYQSKIIKSIHSLTSEQEAIINDSGFVHVNDITIYKDDISITYTPYKELKNCSNWSDGNILIIVDTSKDQSQVDAWQSREFISRVQQLRKEANLHMDDPIDIWYTSSDNELLLALSRKAELINSTLKSKCHPMEQLPASPSVVISVSESDESKNGRKVPLSITLTKK